MIGPLFQSLRPRQWTKNLILFAGIIFSEKRVLFQPWAWVYLGISFFLFCGLSGCVYLMNDLVDIEKDRKHPEKSQRPIASGALPVGTAKIALPLLLLACLGIGYQFPPLFFVSALIYFLLNIGYSFWLKNMVILDVLTVATGFVLRAQAGVGALQKLDPGVYISHWFILCTFMLALFLALAKRRQEIRLLKDDAGDHRKILEEYSPHFIDEMTGLVSASTVMAYAIYTVSAETIRKFGTDRLVYTVPFVLYGIFRYQYLIHIKDLGDKPAEIFLTDRPLQVNMLLWVGAVVLIIHGSH